MSKKSGAGEISQTVEESNKLRAKLGIQPLKADEAKSKEGTSKAPVHAPAPSNEGDGEKKKAGSKKSQEIHKELTSGEGLGDILAREEGKGGAADWVERTRNKDGSMKAASSAAPAASSSAAGKKKAGAEATVPKMKVRHDVSDLPEGSETILTLSDQRLIDKDGNLVDAPDELSNVNLADAEKAKHNDALRKQVDYDPTKEGQDLLEKYNDLKTGPIGFVLGSHSVGGVVEELDPEKKLALLTAMGEKHSLESKFKLQSDYYTEEEMAKFRKPAKRKAKKRKVDKVDKDDAIGDPTAMQAGGRPADAGSDEEDPELYEQLSKQRRLAKRSNEGAMKKGEAALAAVSERLQALGDEDEEKKQERERTILGGKVKEGAESIAMTATTEFCNVVQTPLEKMDTLKHESFRGSTLYKQQVAMHKGVAAGEKKARRGMGSSATPQEIAAAAAAGGEDDIKNLKEEELDMSCASGLAYLRARAQIGNDQDSHKFKKSDNRPLEMSTVDGDIKLEYRDDFGRVQTPKEAFRAISWKFHGKLPGRKNMERRLLRLENEMRLKTMDVMTALPTLRALRHVQAVDAKPYMVLSGANEK